MKRRSFIFPYSFFLITFLSLSSSAQVGWTIFNVSNSALLDNGIQSIAIDMVGRKWVGCAWGLGVYNDTAWTIYTTSNSHLPDMNVKSLAVDKHNNIWIGTNNAGLAKFDGDSTWT